MDATDWITAVGTVLAAIGTVGAFIAVLVQIKSERDARKRLEREAEQRERRAQAERISAWPTSTGTKLVTLSNRSEEPVYRAVASVLAREPEENSSHTSPAYRATLALIPPGEHRTVVEGGWGGVSSRRPGVELAFTDRAGVHWVRFADGRLVEISQPPVEYYDLERPTDWRMPKRQVD